MSIQNVCYLSKQQYETLVQTGTITLPSGITLIYNEEDVYCVEETTATQTEDGLMSASDKIKLDNLEVNDAVLTITQNEVSKGTFTANSNTDTTINITTPIIKKYI